jgi:Flp pilus assembly protein TadG
MKGQSGQGLVELALCAPIVILLTLAAVAIVQVHDAASGLEAAAEAAASAAVRAPDASSAVAAAERRFATVIKLYPLRSPAVIITVGDFARAGEVAVAARGYVDLSWAPGLSPRIELHSKVVLQADRWRSR